MLDMSFMGEAIVDDEVLAVLRDLGDNLIEEMAAMFLEDAPSQIQNIHQAIETQNMDLLKSSAHRLKGMGLSMGAKRFSAISLQLEKKARAGEFTDLDDLLLALDRVWDETRMLLAELVTQR